MAVYMSTPSHSLTMSKASIDDRLAVLKNRQAPVDSVFAFHTNEGKLRYKQDMKGNWSNW